MMKKVSKIFTALFLAVLIVFVAISCSISSETTDPGYQQPGEELKELEIIDGQVYGYSSDGSRVEYDCEFITYQNHTYYVVNNFIVYNQIVIDGYIYNFGDDGKMVTGEKDGYTYGEDGKLVADNIFITINNAT